MQINVEIKDHTVKDTLAKLRAKAKDLTHVMQEIGEIVRSSVIKNFEKSGRPERWAVTKTGTAYRSKSKRTYTVKSASTKGASAAAKKTLIDTARLMNSITAKANPDRAVIGTNVIYGRIHQLGGKAGRGKKVSIPARPFLMVQDEDWPEIRRATIRYITGGTE